MGVGGRSGASLRRDPVLVALVVVAVFVVGWYLSDPAAPAVQARFFWLLQPPLDLLIAYFSWRTARSARSARLARPARRFFGALAFTGLAFFVGDSGQVVQVFRAADPQAAPGPFQNTFFALGLGTLLVTMLTYPTAVSNARERVRFWIDAATVLVGAGVVVWVSVAGSADLVGSLVTGALVLCAVFVAAKLLLAGNAPMTRQAALPCVLAPFIQGAALMLTGLLGRHQPHLLYALQVLPSFLIVAGPRIQELQMRSDDPRPVRPRRPYSLLPYGMIVTADVTLVAVLPPEIGTQAWGALIGVIVITGLVVWRQLHGFTDNQRLVAALDQKVDEIGRHERRFRSLVQHSSDIILVLDEARVVSYASPATDRVLGLCPDDIVGRAAVSLVHPDDVPTVERAAVTRAAGAVVSYQVRVQHADGGWRWLEVVSTNLLDDPSVAGIVCNCRDVTDARRFADQLRHEAYHDGLTQLANRKLFTERLAEVADRTVAMLMIDLDDFKGINDRYGHHIGDAVLIAVADRLRKAVRPDDTPARLGGDEFAVLLPGASESDATAVADRILGALTVPIVADGQTLVVRASVGVTLGSAADPELILRQADAAMYSAKHGGKGQRAEYSASLTL